MSEIPSFEDREKSHREKERMLSVRKSLAEQEQLEERERMKALFDKTREVTPYIAESLASGSNPIRPNVTLIEKEEVSERALGISGLLGATKTRLRDVRIGEGWLLYGHAEGGRLYHPDMVYASILFRDGNIGYLKGQTRPGGRYSDVTGTDLDDGKRLQISARDDAFFEVDIGQSYNSRLEVIDSEVKSYRVSENTKDWYRSKIHKCMAYNEELVMEGLSALAFRHSVSMKGL